MSRRATQSWASLAVTGALILSGCSDGGESSLTDPTAATTAISTAGTSTSTTTVPVTTTTVQTTTTAETTSSSTTTPPPTKVIDLCVIQLRPDEVLAVRSGPSVAFEEVGHLAHDATAVGATGRTARAGSWTEVVFEGEAAWVDSWYLTGTGLSLTGGVVNVQGGPCAVGEPATWAVIDIACDSALNVRAGTGGGYQLLGTLAPDAVDIAGTGTTAFDDDGRRWVQIEFEGQDDRGPGDFGGVRRFGTAWVAGWFLTDEQGVSTDC